MVADECCIDLVGVSVSVQSVEERKLLLDGIRGEVIRIDRSSQVAWLHGIDEPGSLWVAEVRKGGDVDRSHHVVVFVDKVVAMEHVNTIPRCISRNHRRRLASAKENNVLEGFPFVWLNTSVHSSSSKFEQISFHCSSFLRPFCASVLFKMFTKLIRTSLGVAGIVGLLGQPAFAGDDDWLSPVYQNFYSRPLPNPPTKTPKL